MDTAKINREIETLIDQLVALTLPLLPSLVSAIVMFAVGWWFAGWADRTLRSLAGKRIDPTVTSVLATTVRYAIVVLVVVAVLSQLGIQTTSILAALGAVGLAVGLAMQGTLSNMAAGLMLLWLRPFRVGDFIETATFSGTVKDVGLFASELQSWDGIYQFIPNAQLWNTRIVNYTRHPTRLVELKFGVDYNDDIARGRQILAELADSDARVLREPAPITFVGELADSAVILTLRVWSATADFHPLRRDLTERGKAMLQAAGLSIPFPQRDLHIKYDGTSLQLKQT